MAKDDKTNECRSGSRSSPEFNAGISKGESFPNVKT